MRSRRIANPYAIDPAFTEARIRYGIIRIGPGIDYRCEECGATWNGTEDDSVCQWCVTHVADLITAVYRKVLIPEFLGWDHRYHNLSPIDQEVWAHTRGYGRGFEATWLRALTSAVDSGEITKFQAAQAVERYVQWQTQSKRPNCLEDWQAD